MNHGLKNYIVFWLSQALSQLGSAMTGFTLILWAYEQNGSAMTVSLMSFFHYIPYIIASIFAGSFVDSHSKKKIMLRSSDMEYLPGEFDYRFYECFSRSGISRCNWQDCAKGQD